MKKSDIKVGDKVAVYTNGLRGPGKYDGPGGKIDQPHGQHFRGRGVPQNFDAHSTEKWNIGQVAEATVVALDAMRLDSVTRWSNYYNQRDDGILVKFAKPDNIDGKPLKTAVVTARFILEPWANVIAGRKANLDAKKQYADESARKAAEFAPVLADFRAQLAKIGLPVKIYDDKSGLTGDHISISLNRAGDWKDYINTSFKTFDGVTVDTEIFRQLVAIAAKHGETIDTGWSDDDDD